MSLLKFLPSVVINKQTVIAAAAVNAKTVLGLPSNTLVTSGNYSQHMEGSLHYQDKALDFRTRDLTKDQVVQWAGEIQRRLGPDYDVVIESDHLHVEFQKD